MIISYLSFTPPYYWYCSSKGRIFSEITSSLMILGTRWTHPEVPPPPHRPDSVSSVHKRPHSARSFRSVRTYRPPYISQGKSLENFFLHLVVCTFWTETKFLCLLQAIIIKDICNKMFCIRSLKICTPFLWNQCTNHRLSLVWLFEPFKTMT